MCDVPWPGGVGNSSFGGAFISCSYIYDGDDDGDDCDEYGDDDVDVHDVSPLNCFEYVYD
jgi:hypothetical protein